ncbi:hypothetical protein C1H46_024984 [Malus baccata]|uniref:Uncharacterized protein n=1 Tax=Malus baccata TaxID=106549 RepID=A0A540LT25_MALBA|nr:hypothetical protein C1H46_024984 [Malus baccata]
MRGHLMSAEPSTSRTINVSQKDLGAELLKAEVEEGQFAGRAKGGGDEGLGAFDALLKVEVQREREIPSTMFFPYPFILLMGFFLLHIGGEWWGSF